MSARPHRAPVTRPLVTFLLLLAAATAQADIQRLLCFGDSLSDSGNLYAISQGTLPGSPPYYAGRFSNGPVWVEVLADELNLPAPMPSFTGGYNYAFGGARSGTGYLFGFLPNVGTQVDDYLTSHTPAPTDLITYLAGANDLFNGVSPAIAAANVAADLTQLVTAGAKQLLVANLPPLGKTPAHLGMADGPLLDAHTLTFNLQLANTLDNLESQYDVTIYRLDIHAVFDELLAHPGDYGLTNVTQSALGAGNLVVPNPDEYLFWDTVHPTRVGHALLGAYAETIVPEPTVCGAFLIAAVLFGRVARR